MRAAADSAVARRAAAAAPGGGLEPVGRGLRRHLQLDRRDTPKPEVRWLQAVSCGTRPGTRASGCVVGLRSWRAIATSSASPEAVADPDRFAHLALALHQFADLHLLPIVRSSAKWMRVARRRRVLVSTKVPDRVLVSSCINAETPSLAAGLPVETVHLHGTFFMIPSTVRIVDVGRATVCRTRSSRCHGAQGELVQTPAGRGPARDRGHQLRQPEVGAADGRQRASDG